MRKIWTAILALVLLCVCAAGSAELYGLAQESDVEQAAASFLKKPWAPDAAQLVCTQQTGLWRVEALGEDGTVQAILELDCDKPDFMVTFSLAGVEFPPLTGPDWNVFFGEGAAWEETAHEIFMELRGGVDNPHIETFCLQDLGEGRRLFVLGSYGDADAVMILRLPDQIGGTPQLLAYADLDFNWDGHCGGYISIDEAVERAVADLTARFDPDGKWNLPDHLILEERGMILWDADSYSELETPPEVPFWLMTLVDTRADPTLQTYEPNVTRYRYHVLLDPETGEILEVRAPEEYAAG